MFTCTSWAGQDTILVLDRLAPAHRFELGSETSAQYLDRMRRPFQVCPFLFLFFSSRCLHFSNVIFSTIDEISAENTKNQKDTLEEFSVCIRHAVLKFQLKIRKIGRWVTVFRFYRSRRKSVYICREFCRSTMFVVLSSRRSLSSAVQRRVLLNDFIIGRFR